MKYLRWSLVFRNQVRFPIYHAYQKPADKQNEAWLCHMDSWM